MLKGCPVIKILTRPFRFEKSSSDLRNAPSDTPGSCFWRMSQNKKSSLSKTYVISLILPGQKPDWMMTTGSEVQSIFPHWRHLYLLWFTSNRPEILKYILYNYIVYWEGQTGYCTLYHKHIQCRNISLNSMQLILQECLMKIHISQYLEGRQQCSGY